MITVRYEGHVRGQGVMPYRVLSLFLAVISVGVLGESHGQELGTQTIEQRAHQAQEGSSLGAPHEEFRISDEEDLVLLRRPKLFTVESNSSYQFTDNAFLSDKQKTHDYVLSQSVLAQAKTRIAQRVNVFISGSGLLSRYHRNQGLDFNGVTGSAGASLPIDRWLVSLRYDGNIIFDRDFDSHLVTLHNLGLDFSTTIGFNESTALFPFFTVVRVWANPDDFSNTTMAGGGTIVFELSPTVAVFFQGQVDYKSYDDFFEPSTLEARHDYGARMLAALNWTPLDGITVNVTATVARNESTLSTLRYTNVVLSPSLRIFFRF